MDVAEACARLESCDVPHSPAVAVPDLPDHPQLAHREFFVDSVHPAAGRMRQSRPPVRFSGTPADWELHAPEPGRDTEEIVTALRGAATEDLRAAGVIA